MKIIIGLAALSLVIGCSSSDEPASSSAAGAGGTPTTTGGAANSGASPSTSGGGSGAAGSPASALGGSPSAGSASGGASGASASTGGTSAGGASTLGGSPATGGTTAVGGAAAAGASGATMQASGGSAGASTSAPGVRIVGRTAPGSTGSAVRFSWAGVSIHAQFSGTQVSMNLSDGNNKNRFSVVIDGGAPKTVTTSAQTTISLASGLANTTHDLVIWRNTEASIGVSEFTGLSGFGTGGALLAALAAPDRRIEVIGDSLSVGAGVEGTSTSCTPSIDAFTNNYLAYGSVAARAVQADVSTIAWSGIGVYRNYSGSAPTMPQRYDYAIPNDNTAWDFSKYQPQVVVINLGTNDFGAGNPGQPYVDAYVSFVKHVRSKYAGASFILIDMYGGDRLTAINSVVSALKSGGETKVQTLSFSSVPNNNTACNQHPNTTAQNAMGALLAARLKSSLGW